MTRVLKAQSGALGPPRQAPRSARRTRQAGRRIGLRGGPAPAAAGGTGDGSPPGGAAGRRPACDRHSSGTPGRAGLAAAAELATIGAGYAAYSLVRAWPSAPATMLRSRMRRSYGRPSGCCT